MKTFDDLRAARAKISAMTGRRNRLLGFGGGTAAEFGLPRAGYYFLSDAAVKLYEIVWLGEGLEEAKLAMAKLLEKR